MKVGGASWPIQGAVLWGILAGELGSIDGEAFAGSRLGP